MGCSVHKREMVTPLILTDFQCLGYLLSETRVYRLLDFISPVNLYDTKLLLGE